MKCQVKWVLWEPKWAAALDSYRRDDDCKDCDLGLIFFSALERLQKENDTLSPSNFKLKWLRASMTALKGSPFSYSHRADIAGNKVQHLLMRVAELQWYLDSQSHQVSHVTFRTLVRKEHNHGTSNGNNWLDPNKADVESPCHSEPPWTKSISLFSIVWGGEPVLAWKPCDNYPRASLGSGFSFLSRHTMNILCCC